MNGGAGRTDLMMRVLAAARGAAPAEGLCKEAARALSVSGASLMVVAGDGPAALAWSDPVSATLERLQEAHGEGPCVDAHRTGVPVSEPDLMKTAATRWMAFGREAISAGAAAVFAFPLRTGGFRLGAMTLHRTTAGDLTGAQHLGARSVADIATYVILATQRGAPAGALHGELKTVAVRSAVVHQASGMVSVQLGTGVGEAMMVIRAHAFTTDRSLEQVSDDIVARRLRFDGGTE